MVGRGRAGYCRIRGDAGRDSGAGSGYDPADWIEFEHGFLKHSQFNTIGAFFDDSVYLV